MRPRAPDNPPAPKETTGFPERLHEVVMRLGTQRQAARAGGISVDSLARYLRGKNHPPFPVVARMAKAAGISLDWLAGNEHAGKFRNASDSMVRLHPREPAPATAEARDKPLLAIHRDWLEEAMGVDPDQLVLLTVRGDSMAPTLADGDWVLVDCKTTRIDHEDLYVLEVSGRLLIKRVQPLSNGRLQVCSDHPHYAPFEVPTDEQPEQIQVHGRVISCLCKRP